MKASRHLTDEALLLLAGKRLDQAKNAEVRAHLEECAECRARFEKTRTAHAVLSNLSDLGLDEVRKRSRSKHRSAASTPRRVPVLPISGAVMASIVVLAILFAPSIVTDVRASDLLNRAAASEQGINPASGYSLRIGGNSCATMRSGGLLTHVSRSSTCDAALAHIRDTVWSKGNPLSATIFRTWRSSLPRYKDSLNHKSSDWKLRTSTDSGSIRFATLSLREPNFKPTELTVHFADDEELNVSEDVTPVGIAADNFHSAPPLVPTTLPQQNSLSDSNDPLEIRAWQTLHDLHADSGWEATVLRTGTKVSVRAVTDTQERKNELQTGLAALAPVEIHIETADEAHGAAEFLPQRSFSEPGKALAEPWLKEHFPDSSTQNNFKNQVVRLSGTLLGHALFIDRLKQRQVALSHCSCAGELTSLLLVEEAELRSRQSALLASLAPILDAKPVPTVKTITAKDAIRMDLIVQELLISSGDSSASFESQLSTLREILGTTKNSSAPGAQNAALSL